MNSSTGGWPPFGSTPPSTQAAVLVKPEGALELIDADRTFLIPTPTNLLGQPVQDENILRHLSL
eukprot:CAMPEP_0206225808 /NCGR_PEP_ID=MMETSP0047_2-20121206/7742_1 /ASSEMBLY_ACC=CAM_ASM_000192 /TAXON_ID=195065 /ORGANISM="Chroomonas mesostigmatica_cf, Strain CCMP1168" /LENGTH=63 /DNA_ID=CAMNT_0053648827 /DNA_START=797 /DNA_END=985 /DNA_ORIENTATION=-